MRTFGVISVSLGITLLIASPVALLVGTTFKEIVIGLCIAGVALLLLLVGILLTRRTAAHSGPETEAAASESMLTRGASVLWFLSAGENVVKKPNPQGDALDRFQSFDLNTMTVAGWLLVLVTALFMLVVGISIHRLVFGDTHQNVGRLVVVGMAGGLLSGVAFFYVGRLLLKKFGVPFSATNNTPPEPPHTDPL